MINTTQAWQQLMLLQRSMQSQSLLSLFENQPSRAAQYSLSAAGIFLDYSKNRINQAVMTQLFALTKTVELSQHIEALFAGLPVNRTEQQPALHTAARQPLDEAKAEVVTVRRQMQRFVATLPNSITDIVNIGIGGSDLGPKLICNALKPFQKNQKTFHFISNIDDYELNRLLAQLNPNNTLFIIASKSFGTPETLLNLKTAQRWFNQYNDSKAAWQEHFVAVTANKARALQNGFSEQQIFHLWNWVGGRYSLWSAVGLSIALCLGYENFEKLLSGAHAMDVHFSQAEFSNNMPVILALLEVWTTNFWHAQTQAIIPYLSQLKLLPSYLQQLVMESNGKGISNKATALAYETSPIIWGEVGTNCQHSFMQLLHQGRRLIPVDFIATVNTQGSKTHHQTLLANCFSQARVLMTGKNLSTVQAELIKAGLTKALAESLAPHKVLPGNQPSNMLLMKSLTPETLGALISLYEHKVFVSSAIWGINPFDQWGVEMGKTVAKEMLPCFQKNSLNLPYDDSTNQLITFYMDNNETT